MAKDRIPGYLMSEKESEGLNLAALEARVDELIRTMEQLSAENEALRAQQAALTMERATLIEKTELARSRIEAMIMRLKSMEIHS
jgi:cell division protein ZapB